MPQSLVKLYCRHNKLEHLNLLPSKLETINCSSNKIKSLNTFPVKLKELYCTNNLFDIESNDDGTWRRIRKCDFLAKFIDEGESYTDETPYIYVKDKSLKDKLPTFAPYFASMLVKRAFETNGIVEDCETVLNASNKYRKGQDHIAAFISEKIVKTGDNKDKINTQQNAQTINNNVHNNSHNTTNNNIENQSETITNFIQHLNLKNICLIGLNNGANLALHIFYTRKIQINSLILIGNTYINPTGDGILNINNIPSIVSNNSYKYLLIDSSGNVQQQNTFFYIHQIKN